MGLLDLQALQVHLGFLSRLLGFVQRVAAIEPDHALERRQHLLDERILAGIHDSVMELGVKLKTAL
ncbi:hypothetical protein D3C75_1209130 [compost metagenome]